MESILSFINPVVPVGTVALLIWMAIMSRDIKHLKEVLGKDISRIQKDLSNHITDTNKKIDKLENNMGTDLRDINRKIEKTTDKLEAGQAKIEANLEAKLKVIIERELKASQAEIKNKLDKLLDKKSG